MMNVHDVIEEIEQVKESSPLIQNVVNEICIVSMPKGAKDPLAVLTVQIDRGSHRAIDAFDLGTWDDPNLGEVRLLSFSPM